MLYDFRAEVERHLAFYPSTFLSYNKLALIHAVQHRHIIRTR